MEPNDPNAVENIEEVYSKIADILVALADVGSGDYSVRLESAFPESHPLGALCAGINEMIGQLADEQERGEKSRKELEEKLAMIERQREAIRELSTPIMEVWDKILCLPIVGVIDSMRSAEMTDALLRAVVSAGAHSVIIDITGIEIMDTRTADHFVRMAKAVGLLGANCVLTGINPQIAQTIVHMGIDMAGVRTHRSLRDALYYFVRPNKRAVHVHQKI
jgi:rsbT co-antagonist protein RsbR